MACRRCWRTPDQLALLREKPELIDSAIEDLLRFTNPVGTVAPRFAREDMEVAGVLLASAKEQEEQPGKPGGALRA